MKKYSILLFFIFIKNEYTKSREIKKIMLSIKLIFYYQVIQKEINFFFKNESKLKKK